MNYKFCLHGFNMQLYMEAYTVFNTTHAEVGYNCILNTHLHCSRVNWCVDSIITVQPYYRTRRYSLVGLYIRGIVGL